MKAKRIGIYAGTFDPVHAGHVSFALQAIQTAKLDKVYFLPERRPQHKMGVEHFGHRVAMLARAVRPHPKLGVLELDDISFTVKRTLLHLEQLFPNDQIVMLVGSDTAPSMQSWPLIDRMVMKCELVVGMRTSHDKRTVEQAIQAWPIQPKQLTIFDSFAPDVSSHRVREALRARAHARGVLASVARYSNSHWLYVSLA
jgi:nicotinate-nucleotide adenylyltransferase